MDFFVTVEWLSFYCLLSHSDFYGIYYYIYDSVSMGTNYKLHLFSWGWLRLEECCYLILYFRMKFFDLWLRAENVQNTHVLLQFN